MAQIVRLNINSVDVSIHTDSIVDRRILAAAEKFIVEIHHHEPAVFGDELEDVVVHIPARVAQSERGGMRENYRGFGNCQHVPHCLHGCL